MTKVLNIEETLNELNVNMEYVEYFLSATLDITTDDLFDETAQEFSEREVCNVRKELYGNHIDLWDISVTIKSLKEFIEQREDWDEGDTETYSLHALFSGCQYNMILDKLTKNRVNYMLAMCLQYMKENLEMTKIAEEDLELLKDYIKTSETLDMIVQNYITFIEENIKPTVSKSTLHNILNKGLSKEEIIKELEGLTE